MEMDDDDDEGVDLLYDGSDCGTEESAPGPAPGHCEDLRNCSCALVRRLRRGPAPADPGGRCGAVTGPRGQGRGRGPPRPPAPPPPPPGDCALRCQIQVQNRTFGGGSLVGLRSADAFTAHGRRFAALLPQIWPI